MHQRTPLCAGKNRRVDWLLPLVGAEDDRAPCSAQCLLGRRRCDRGVRDRRGIHAPRDQARHVRHIDEQDRADRIRDLAHASPIDDARVRRKAGEEHLRPHLFGQLLHGVVVDGLGVARDAIGVDLVELAAEVRGASMGQVAAGGKVHAHHAIARFAHCHVHGSVRL